MRINKNRRSLSLGLVALCACAPSCTTPQPVYDAQGRYVGYTQKVDDGRTLSAFGAINGGLLGLFMQGVGNKISEEGKRQIEDEYRTKVQRQLDQAVQQAPPKQPDEAFFTCNHWQDLNGDGKLSLQANYNEFVGIKDRFSASEKISNVVRTVNRKGKIITYKLLDSAQREIYGLDSRISFNDYFQHHSFSPMTLPPGSYAATWSVDGQDVGITNFNVYEPEEQKNLERNQEDIPRYVLQNTFFTCNHWQDLNGDGKVDPSCREFVGIKKNFLRGERITHVARIIGMKGRMFKIKTFHDERLIKEDNTVPIRDYLALHVVKEKNTERMSPGLYTLNYYVDDELLGTTTYTIAP